MSSSTRLPPHCLTFLVLLMRFTCQGYGQYGSLSCIEPERQALLRFKHGLHVVGNITADPLPSWGSGDDKRDCCKWLGVRCSNHSGHVVSLNINGFLQSLNESNPFAVISLEGKLSPSLFELRHVTSLKIGFVNFSGSGIPSSIAALSRLRELKLTETQLSGKIPAELGNLSRLESFYLSGNHLHGSIPETFSKLTSLKLFSLLGNRLSGSIPDIFRNMSHLYGLYLGGNVLEGEIPRSMWNLTSLGVLRLVSNKLHGNLPISMSQLNLLEQLDLAGNLFHGDITEAHFTNFSMLNWLDLASNPLSLSFHPNWTPPFNLYLISLGSCQLGPRFPAWLQTQTKYFFLNMSNSGISDSIPTWFWSLPSMIAGIDLSRNHIHGGIENYNISLQPATFIDLNSNRLEGSVPAFLTQFVTVILYQNRFTKLNFSGNTFNGTFLRFLDISTNKLSGELLDCWSRFKSLEYLILSNNNLRGRVPPSFGSLNNTQVLKLYKNSFSGDLPRTMQNCRSLRVLDLGENKLSGPIPAWFGTSLSNLTILSLRINSFNGGIPSSLCRLSNLKVLDLSFNNITKSIPNCISSFGAMITRASFQTMTTRIALGGSIYYEEDIRVVWKGGIVEFRSTLALVIAIDLSNNKLNGKIPREITELSQVVSLNLSRNNLSGQIPPDIGRMKSLDALDLSSNHLTGRIPQSLAQIDRLGRLDLSNNNLHGRIPTGTQLQSFESAYWGNPELCGNPLSKSCSDTTAVLPEPDEEDSDEHGGFYVSMAIGFVTTFSGVCGVLMFNKAFRHAYFKAVTDVGDSVFYVKTKVQWRMNKD